MVILKYLLENFYIFKFRTICGDACFSFGFLNIACLNRSKLLTAASLDTSNRTFGLDDVDENANNYFTSCAILY